MGNSCCYLLLLSHMANIYQGKVKHEALSIAPGAIGREQANGKNQGTEQGLLQMDHEKEMSVE